MNELKTIFLMLFLLSCTKASESYTLSLSSNPSNAGTVNGDGNYIANSSVTITATAKYGYKFLDWFDASNDNVISRDKSFTFPISSNTTLIARFGPAATDTLISKQESSGMKVIPNYEANVPKDRLQVMTRYLGDLFITQGVSVTQSGAINHSGETEMVINTKDLENRQLYKPIVGGGPHVWISKTFSSLIYPWINENQNLVFQMLASVPTVNLTDAQGNTAQTGFSATQAPVTQLSFGFYLLDETTGKTFAYIICAYESRGSYQETAKSNDTFVNYVSSPIEESSLYITKSGLSTSLQSSPFSNSKLFKVNISAKNLLKAIRDASHGMSEDLTKYRLTFAGVLFELPNYVQNGHNTSVVKVSKFSVYIE